MTTETKRKDSPEGLAEGKYFNLIEHAADGIAIIQDGVFKLVNTALTHISGYDKEELRDMPFIKLLTPASQKMTMKRYQARLAGKKVPQVYEVQAVTKDGQIRDIELNAALTEYEGRVADEAIVRDITERKQAEAAIQKTQQEKTAILDSMSELVIFQDLEHHMLWVNKIARESAGLTQEQMLGRHCYEVWSQRQTPCVGCPVAKARKTGKPQKEEITTPDGRVWSIRGYPTRDENGVITGMLEVALDITERKEAEQALADEATRRRILVDQSRDGIVILDQDGKVYEANQHFAEMLGYTPEEARELHVWDWEYLYPRERVIEMVRTVDEAGDHFETQHRRKDGSVYDVEISTNGTVIAGQKLIFCVCRDITERKQAEEALQAERNKLQSVIGAMEYDLTIQDKDYNVIYQNEPSRASSGGNRVGEKCYRVYEGRDRICDGCPVKKAFKDGKSHTVERKRVMPSGEVVFYENTANPIRDAGGNIVSCLEVGRNVTERKKAEEEIAWLAKFPDENPSPVMRIVQDGIIFYANKAALPLLNEWKCQVGQPLPKYWHKLISGVLRSGSKKEAEINVGEQIISVTFSPVAGKDYVNLYGLDITERKQAEQALQESEEKFSKAFRASPGAIAIFKLKDNTIIEVNESFTRFTGYTREELINHGIDEFNLWVYEEERAKMMQLVQEQGRVYEEEYHSRMKSGETRVGLFSGELISIHGEPCTTFVITDITERKKREQLQKAENYVLTLLGQGANLSELLDAIVRLGEQNDPSIKGSALLFDPSKSKELLFQASAPSLPDDYQELFANGIPIGPKSGSCGTAAHRRERVIVPDIASSPLFKPSEEVIKRAVNNGLLAVWSQPIIASNGDLLGTIANYSNKVGKPSAGNLRVLEWSARIAALAIERKKAEEALRESEERYRAVIEGAHDMILSITLDGSIDFVNQAWLDTLGYTKADLPSLSLGKAIHPDSLPHCREMFAGVIKGESVHNVQATFLTKDGREILVEGNAAPRYIGDKVVATQGIFRDITERKNMEKQLQENNEQLDAQNEELRAINEELQATEEELQHSQERLERMFKSVTDSIVVAATDGTILKVNQSAVQMHGFASEDEMLGRNAIELSAPRDRKKITRNMRRAMKGGTTKSQEYSLLRADGSEFPAELSTSALKDSWGNVIGHITTVRDITERKQAEEREDQLQQELSLAGRLVSIGQLAAGVAHEINNPLTGVIGFSHLMLSRDIPDDMKQDLQIIHSEAQRVAKIVENLLVFAHQRKTGQEYVAVNDIITRVLELRAYEMKVNNIEVEAQLDPDLPLTMADAGQLQQVFLNIVLNAEYFMTKARNKGKLLVKTEKIDGNIRASFTDDGTGISKENLDNIFNPFFTTKEVGKGTGLGLSICHGIITQHKGRIYAQSQPGKGATFVIELPIVAEPVQAGKAKVTKKEPQKPRKAKILVVDDETAILTFLSRLLTEWGHSVETINNADTALEKLNTERYSLILLDIKLPGMSGIELYHHIEEIAPALARRVMFITGDVMEGATRGFLEKTGAPYITKPLDIEVLKKMINHALNQTQVTVKASG